MSNSRSQHADATVAVLQTEVAGLRQQIGGLATKEEVGAIVSQVTALAVEVRNLISQQRTPWNTLGTWAGVLMVVILATAGLVHFMLTSQIEAVRQVSSAQYQGANSILNITSDRLATLRASHDSHVAQTTSRLQKVEVQMHAQSNYRNLEVENLHRLVGQLWLSEFHRPLGGKLVYPIQGSDTGDGFMQQ